MRTKEELINESLKLEVKTPAWDHLAATNERLSIEVLADIRDILAFIETRLKDIDKTIHDAP